MAGLRADSEKHLDVVLGKYFEFLLALAVSSFEEIFFEYFGGDFGECDFSGFRWLIG